VGNDWEEGLAAVATAASIEGDAAKRLTRYVAELLRWSRRLNLTALDGVGIVERLIAPTLPFVAEAAYRAAPAFADLGSGNGVPGVILQVIAPRPRCCLIEPRQRRAAFLRHLVRSLPLVGTEVIEARAEAVAWDAGERVALVVSRAVAAPAVLLPWATPLLAAGGAVALWGEAAEVAGWHVEPAGSATLYRRCFT
jgi:16S rRNA (guanine527-N7)-methyltransferase